MSLTALMIEQIGAARTIVEDGAKVIPPWRINTPEGSYLVFTRFDHDKPELRERVLHLMSRFMTWKMATSFVLTVQTWWGVDESGIEEEALLAVGVSHHERLGLVQRIAERRYRVRFGLPDWLMPDQVDETYFRLLPSGASEITAKEAEELAFVFGENGELAADGRASRLRLELLFSKCVSCPRAFHSGGAMFENDMLAVALVVVVFAVLAYDLSFNHGEWLAIMGAFANDALREIRR